MALKFKKKYFLVVESISYLMKKKFLGYHYSVIYKKLYKHSHWGTQETLTVTQETLNWRYAFNMICIQNDVHSKLYAFKMIMHSKFYAFKMIMHSNYMHSKWLCIQNGLHSKDMCIQNVCIQNVNKQKVLHSKCLRWNPCIVKFAGKYFSVELPSTRISTY